MKSGVRIYTADNGWLVIDGNDNTWAVFQGVDDEVEAFADLLRWLSECLGPPTSRHSERRIYIEVRPGDKYEG